MSYARKGLNGSDVYVYGTSIPPGLISPEDRGSPGVWVCHGCTLDGGNASLDSAERMLSHLMQHRDAGHTVPDTAIARLRLEVRP